MSCRWQCAHHSILTVAACAVLFTSLVLMLVSCSVRKENKTFTLTADDNANTMQHYNDTEAGDVWLAEFFTRLAINRHVLHWLFNVLFAIFLLTAVCIVCYVRKKCKLNRHGKGSYYYKRITAPAAFDSETNVTQSASR